MSVTWTTAEEGCDPSVQYSLLSDSQATRDNVWPAISTFSSKPYGASPNQTAGGESTTWFTQDGSSVVVTNQQMCGGDAQQNRFRKSLHTVSISQLEPDRLYQYHISGESLIRQFYSPPLRGAKEEMSYVIYGDMGYQDSGKDTEAEISFDAVLALHRGPEGPLDLVMHVGDLSYADGVPEGWDSFMSMIEPLASEVPYMVAIGNHEYGYEGSAENDASGASEPYQPDWGNFGTDSGGECGVMAKVHFPMPSGNSIEDSDIPSKPHLYNHSRPNNRFVAPILSLTGDEDLSDNSPFYYSFDSGLIHFAVISTEHDLTPGSLQYRWLEKDLAAVDRCVTPWLVISMHRPMYVVYPHKSNLIVGEHLREFLEDLFLDNKVDIVVSGHVHSYYRSCSVRHEECTNDNSGIVHLVIGTGGHKLSSVDEQQRLWVKTAALDHGFGHVRVTGETLQYRFIRSRDNQVVDEALFTAQVPRSGCQDFMSRKVIFSNDTWGKGVLNLRRDSPSVQGTKKGTSKNIKKSYKSKSKLQNKLQRIIIVDDFKGDGSYESKSEMNENDR